MSRIIKRYDNRKLYDTEDRKYVSLEEIAALIRKGVDVQVIDKNTEEDITTQTLTQIILQEGKKGNNPLSKDILHSVIRLGSDLLDDGLRQVRQSLDPLIPSYLSKIFGSTNSNDLNQLKEKVASLEAIINELVKHRASDQPEDSKS